MSTTTNLVATKKLIVIENGMVTIVFKGDVIPKAMRHSTSVSAIKQSIV